MPEISQEDLDECIQLVYSRWSKEFDELKKVKADKPNGDPDWHLFHAEQLKNNGAAEAKWNAMRLRLSPLHSLTKRGI